MDDAACQEEREGETEVLETQQSMHNFIRPTQPKPQSQGAKQNDGRDSHYQSKEKFAEVKRVGNAEISGANHFAYQ